MEHLIEFLYKLLRFFPRFKAINPDEGAVVIRCGRYKKTLDGGHFRFYWPVITKIKTIPSVRQIEDFYTLSMTTKDGHTFVINGSVEYVVNNPRKAILDVFDYDKNLKELGMNALRESVNNKTLAECIADTNAIRDEVHTVLDDESETYGLEILRVFIGENVKCRAFRLIN